MFVFSVAFVGILGIPVEAGSYFLGKGETFGDLVSKICAKSNTYAEGRNVFMVHDKKFVKLPRDDVADIWFHEHTKDIRLYVK